MIKRYSRKELTDIWSEENKYKIWLNVEVAAVEAMEKLNQIPKGVASTVKKKARINVKRIHQIEANVKHDVIAFLTSVTEKAGIKARYLHQGMTSSDVLDTSFNIQLVQSGKILLKDLDQILKVLKRQAKKYKFTPCMGRSHGIHAEPITFGLKLGSFYNEFKRNLYRLEQAIEEISICSISGPVGTYDSIDPRVEQYVAKKLKLKCEDVSTQIIPRDRHAFFFSVLGIIGSSIERFAVEIRHLQRTEILEVEEKFDPKQKGSSAMPHKRNPVLSENLTGLSRYIRSAVIPSMENIVLWHERDISHSSVERILTPNITIALDFSLNRLNEIIKTMRVYKVNMKNNLNLLGGLHNSQKLLLTLTKRGMSRQIAYSLVQKNAMKAWDNKKSFFEVLKNDKKILKHISINDLREILGNNDKNKKIDWIFKNKIK